MEPSHMLIFIYLHLWVDEMIVYRRIIKMQLDMVHLLIYASKLIT